MVIKIHQIYISQPLTCTLGSTDAPWYHSNTSWNCMQVPLRPGHQTHPFQRSRLPSWIKAAEMMEGIQMMETLQMMSGMWTWSLHQTQASLAITTCTHTAVCVRAKHCMHALRTPCIHQARDVMCRASFPYASKIEPVMHVLFGAGSCSWQGGGPLSPKYLQIHTQKHSTNSQ